jgi:hypothetical protein
MTSLICDSVVTGLGRVEAGVSALCWICDLWLARLVVGAVSVGRSGDDIEFCDRICLSTTADDVNTRDIVAVCSVIGAHDAERGGCERGESSSIEGIWQSCARQKKS